MTSFIGVPADRTSEAADGVIHLAFTHDFSDYAGAGRTERAAVRRMLDAIEGSGRPFLLASGLVHLTPGRSAREDDASPRRTADSVRGGSENLALSCADRGVWPVALRFAPTVHGSGDGGFVSVPVDIARTRSPAGCIGDGSSRWAAVHVADAARLVRLALHTAPPAFRVHAAAGEGIPSRDIASALGDFLGLPTVSVPPEDAAEHLGWIGHFFGLDQPTSSARTRELHTHRPDTPRRHRCGRVHGAWAAADRYASVRGTRR
ncbi:3-beta hydroxysteroid dehydrogenase [Streptomyces sp. NPDC060205]|uniref:3-beta hydroxysteroid dehydrogenase n=1 Tax=Streptomyces sp. NPDC060205 TaxID=3347072 RepID=UPI0036637D37